MDWSSSMSVCHHNAMSFVTFKTSAEALHFSSTADLSLWVGISDTVSEGTFMNYYGRSTNVGSLLNWLAGEPNNGGGTNEDCVDTIYTSNMFNDADCGNTGVVKGACMSKSLFSI